MFPSAVIHKGYSMEFKQDVVRCANENSNISAATRFKVDVKKVREWKKQIEKITSTNPKKQKQTGGGIKLTDVDLEESLLAWLYMIVAAMLFAFQEK